MTWHAADDRWNRTASGTDRHAAAPGRDSPGYRTPSGEHLDDIVIDDIFGAHHVVVDHVVIHGSTPSRQPAVGRPCQRPPGS